MRALPPLLVLLLVACGASRPPPAAPPAAPPDLDEVLAALRDTTNREYGFMVGERFERLVRRFRENGNSNADAKAAAISGTPAINNGACAVFARIFREEWHERFDDEVVVAFVMLADLPEDIPDFQLHAIVRLPDGRYYDGGNGVMSHARVLELYEPFLGTVPDGARLRIEEMTEFDAAAMRARGGFAEGQTFESVPGFSEAFVRRAVSRHLERIR